MMGAKKNGRVGFIGLKDVIYLSEWSLALRSLHIHGKSTFTVMSQNIFLASYVKPGALINKKCPYIPTDPK